jgi:NAD(P)-dependent dehydrogenase (short-subunit alcohol dehydrogenase family)
MADAASSSRPTPHVPVPPQHGRMDTDTFSDTVALVTGASRGLGRALSLELARNGVALAVCARDAARLDDVAARARRAGAPDVLAVQADVGDARDLERLVAATLDRYPRVDVLVNNASALGPTPLPYLADAPSTALQQVFDVNVMGAFRLTQAVIGGMLLRDHGVVVNISSDAAVEGYPGWGLYGASKAALDALTRAWSAELQGTGVRVLAVDPGDMDTDMHRAADPDADPTSLRKPEDVAGALVALLHDNLAAAPVRLVVTL